MQELYLLKVSPLTSVQCRYGHEMESLLCFPPQLFEESVMEMYF